MASEQQIQQKQKYLRQNIDPDHYEDFAEFFQNEVGSGGTDITKFTLDELKNFVNKFNVSKAKEQQEQKHQRSFAIYQTADIQQAYQAINAIQNNVGQFQSNQNFVQPTHPQFQPNQVQFQKQQNPFQSNQNGQSLKPSPSTAPKIISPQKPSYQSASDLLDSVMSESQRNVSSPTKNQAQTSQNIENKYRSNSQIDIFQKGNIWATTSNVQNQRKSEFDTFWQFSSNANTMANMNKVKKQQFKTESPFGQGFDFKQPNTKQTFTSDLSKSNELKKPAQSAPSFDELAKSLNMGKKPNTFGSGQVEAPSNMKRQDQTNLGANIPYSTRTADNTNANRKNTKSPSTKQIKLIAQKPINQPSQSLMSVTQPSSIIKPPTSNMASVYAYKGSKIPYKGPTIHRTQFKDVVKCAQASIRTQLNDNRLEISIEKHEIVQKNFFVPDYVMYYMSVKPLNIVCKRNYEDFTKLKSALQKFYPGMQLPYLEKNSWFETNAQNIKKQKTMLEFFVNDLIKNAEIRNSRIFEDFLTLKEHKAIKRKFEQYAKMDELKALEEMVVSGGKVEVVISQSQRIYHEQLEKLLQQFDDILGKKNKLMETLGAQFIQVNQTLSSLSKLSVQMSENVKRFNQIVTDFEIPSLQMTFNIISKSFQQWASRISFQSKVVNKRLVPFYKYQKDNLDTMKTLLATEGQFYKSYMKRANSENTNDNYGSSSLKGSKVGILQESRNMTVLKYQLGYLSNMLCKQSVRFFEVMSDNFKAKWIYQAEKYNQRLSKDVQFYTNMSAMAK